MAAFIHRLTHRLVYVSHGGWVYVDDYLWIFQKNVALLLAALVIVFQAAMGVPISWQKLRMSMQIL